MSVSPRSFAGRPRLLAGLFACLLLPVPASAQLLIDQMATPMAPVVAGPGAPASATADDPVRILGGEREVYVEVAGGSAILEVNDAPCDVSAHAPCDASGLRLVPEPATTTRLVITYDGDDDNVFDGDDTSTLDFTGLGGIDVTTGGNDTFAADLYNVGNQTTATFRLYSDAARCSEATVSTALLDPLSPPSVVNTQTFLLASYDQHASMFAPCAGSGPADFTQIGAIVVEVNMTPAETVPLQVLNGSIKIVASASLPVELAAFDAFADGREVVLRWTTASETNNAGFEVLRAASGAADAWQVAGFVPGRGTTTDRQDYAFRLDDLAPGAYRFRLRQIDFDGTYAYGPAVEVAVAPKGTFELAPAYPNPFNPATRLSLSVAREQHVAVEVFDLAGRRVAVLFDGVVAAGRRIPIAFDGGSLPSGSYVVRATGATFTASRTVTLLR